MLISWLSGRSIDWLDNNGSPGRKDRAQPPSLFPPHVTAITGLACANAQGAAPCRMGLVLFLRMYTYNGYFRPNQVVKFKKWHEMTKTTPCYSLLQLLVTVNCWCARCAARLLPKSGKKKLTISRLLATSAASACCVGAASHEKTFTGQPWMKWKLCLLASTTEVWQN